MSEYLLKVDNISKSFGGLNAVKDISFEISKGEIIGLIGPNGAGKTTIVNMISGFLVPNEGYIYLKDQNITGSSSYKIARKGMTRTFQITSLFGDLSVYENIQIGSYLKDQRNMLNVWKPKAFKLGSDQLRSHAFKIQQLLGLEKYSKLRATDLSYGDQRYLEIAIALGSNPEILLLDEPAAGLNEIEADGLADLLLDLKNNQGLTIILVEHNVDMVVRVADKILVMDQGKKIAFDTPEKVISNELVIEAYLGGDDNA